MVGVVYDVVLVVFYVVVCVLVMVVISYDFVVNCGVEFGWFFYLVFGEFVDC